MFSPHGGDYCLRHPTFPQISPSLSGSEGIGETEGERSGWCAEVTPTTAFSTETQKEGK